MPKTTRNREQIQRDIDIFDELNTEITAALERMKKLYASNGFDETVMIVRPHNSRGQEIAIPVSFEGYVEMLPEMLE